MRLGGAVALFNANHNARAELKLGIGISTVDLRYVGKHHALALAIDLLASGVIQPKHDVLRRNNGGLSV